MLHCNSHLCKRKRVIMWPEEFFSQHNKHVTTLRKSQGIQSTIRFDQWHELILLKKTQTCILDASWNCSQINHMLHNNDKVWPPKISPGQPFCALSQNMKGIWRIIKIHSCHRRAWNYPSRISEGVRYKETHTQQLNPFKKDVECSRVTLASTLMWKWML